METARDIYGCVRGALCATALLLCYTSSVAQKYDTNLIPYRKNDKWGYCDGAKKIIVPPQFTEVWMFDGALSVAKADSFYCVINKKGNVVYKSTHFTKVINNGADYVAEEKPYVVQVFDAQGRAVSQKYSEVENFNKYGYLPVTAAYVKSGLLDKSFREVIAPRYRAIDFFSETLLCVYDDVTRKYSLYDLKTNKQFAGGYDMIYPPREGYMMVKKGDKYGFIDVRGNELIPAKYDKETPESVKRGESYNESTYEGYNYDGFYGGLALVTDGGRAGYINSKGNIVIAFEFEKAFGFKGNYAWVKKDGKWGIINNKGKYILKPEYTEPAYVEAKELMALDGFHEGLVAVAKDSLFGYADTTGKIVLPFRYTRAEPFHDGLAPVYIHGRMGMINLRGEMVIEPRYHWIEGAGSADGYPFAQGCGIAFLPDNKQVIIDKNGKQLLPMEFDADNTIWFSHGMADAKAGGKRYVFNNKGQVVFTFDNDDLISIWSSELVYSFHDKCFVNIRTKVKYCD